MTNFNIVSLFPEFFVSPLDAGIMGRAQKNGLISFAFYNPRNFSRDKHRHVDDRPYGGGPGMIMQPQPVYEALSAIPEPGKILLMSPSGSPFNQKIAAKLAQEKTITVICGRYEGIDARIGELFPIMETSVTDAVLNGGETAALAVIEAVCRLVPGFMGTDESAADESFSAGLLEYPQYTRPETFMGIRTPHVLACGDHLKVAHWRRRQSLLKTLRLRPDLLANAPLNGIDAKILAEFDRERPGKNLFFCLFHYPVFIEKNTVGVSSLTNLDIHDIARISRSYGMGPFFVLTPLRDQLNLLQNILTHWINGANGDHNQDRRHALELVRPVMNFAQMDELAAAFYGVRPAYVVTSAKWPENSVPALGPADVLELCRHQPVGICLGTARGLDIDSLDFEFSRIRPLRFLNDNHLSVRGAAAILADRILGDFY